MNADYATHASDITQEAARQLDEYFGRKRTVFDIPLLFAGTDFQKKVWRALLEIPYGQTLSYGEMARRLGLPDRSKKIFVGIGTGKNAWRISLFFIKVNISDIGKFGYFCGVKM